LIIPPALAASVAVVGNFVLSLGMTLQKQHIGWIGRDRPPGARRGRDLALWLLGTCLMNVVWIFTFVALFGLSTNVVGAITGTSVAFTAMLAKLMLKEKLGKRRLAWTIALFAAIAAAGFLGETGASGGKDLSPGSLYAFLAVPLAAGGLLWAFRSRLRGPRLAAGIAAASGAIGGFMIFPMRAIQVSVGPELSSVVASPYLYAYLVAGLTSFVLIQVAYKDGEMSTVAPALYGMQVLWPAIGSPFVFGSAFSLPQAAAFLLVAVCVAAISGARSPLELNKMDLPKIDLPRIGGDKP